MAEARPSVAVVNRYYITTGANSGKPRSGTHNCDLGPVNRNHVFMSVYDRQFLEDGDSVGVKFGLYDTKTSK